MTLGCSKGHLYLEDQPIGRQEVNEVEIKKN